MQGVVASIYLGTLVLLALYGAHRLWFLVRFRRARPTGAPTRSAHASLPIVTVQLPLFNERTVAARLIRCIGELDYPRDRLEIQILDDSSDETRDIVDCEAALLRQSGLDARVVRRAQRTGFKAGALDHGMQSARGELLCVFDADFLPEPDFLLRLVPHFDDPRVGMVQARWGHCNRDDDVLTRAQSTLLDGHFVIEHAVRFRQGLFFNFNGTAGLWRRATIESAGGWEHDTLTEDLDLSYRAQLAGWRFVYAPDVVAPAEVPPDILAFKSQQHRWAKGSVQVARKLLGRILRADITTRQKLEAIAHLTGNTGYPLVLCMALVLPLALNELGDYSPFAHLAMFVVCTLSVVLFYDASQRAVGRSFAQRLFDVPAALALGIGMCVGQTKAVVEGLVRDTGVFVRTPKRGDVGAARRYRAALAGLPGIELLLAAWFGYGIWRAVELSLWGTLPFLVLFLTGFAWVGGLSAREGLRALRGVRASEAKAELAPAAASR